MDPNQGKLGSTTLIPCANTGRAFDKGAGDAAREVLYSFSQRRTRRNWVAHRERLWRHFSHSAQRSCRGTLRGPAPAWAPVPSVASAASERKRDANPVPVDEPDSEHHVNHRSVGWYAGNRSDPGAGARRRAAH